MEDAKQGLSVRKETAGKGGIEVREEQKAKACSLIVWSVSGNDVIAVRSVQSLNACSLSLEIR